MNAFHALPFLRAQVRVPMFLQEGFSTLAFLVTPDPTCFLALAGSLKEDRGHALH
jgi:hypothetical protein